MVIAMQMTAMARPSIDWITYFHQKGLGGSRSSFGRSPLFLGTMAKPIRDLSGEAPGVRLDLRLRADRGCIIRVSMDFLRELGPLAFAGRLKRLAERLISDAENIYQRERLPFHPRWFSLFYLLQAKGPLAVTEVANHLRFTHPAVINLSKELTAQGLITSQRDPADGRKRLLALSEKGEALYSSLEPLWSEWSRVMSHFFQQTGANILELLELIEDAFEEKPISVRVLDRLHTIRGEGVEILDYDPRFRDDFRRINEGWLRQYFEVEPSDAATLADPETHILEPGGAILFARIGGEIVGTCALIPYEQGSLELAKMGVTEAARNQRVGSRLLEAAIQKAIDMGVATLFLRTSPLLGAANHLYRKYGFSTYAPPNGLASMYQRTTIFLKKSLRPAATEMDPAASD